MDRFLEMYTGNNRLHRLQVYPAFSYRHILEIYTVHFHIFTFFSGE